MEVRVVSECSQFLEHDGEGTVPVGEWCFPGCGCCSVWSLDPGYRVEWNARGEWYRLVPVEPFR